MKFRLIALALVAALLGTTAVAPFAQTASAQGNQAGLTIPVTEDLGDGQTFTGDLTITRLSQQAGNLVASGRLVGQITGGTPPTQQISQSFNNVALDLSADQACDILTLDLGPIFLDLLGLQIDLSPVNLNVTAEPGPGNLLGNLLCAVAGLLDQNPTGQLQGILNDLLNIVNRLLRGLGA